MNDNLLILVDGSSYLYRAFYAVPNLTNAKGEPTGAIYGVLNMLRSLIGEFESKYIAVVFDAKGPTFRHHMYKEYKAHRPPMPDELQQQIKPLHQIIQAMHIPLLCVPGVEADDVIGTLANHATDAGLKTLISTGDKDMAQLVNDKVTLINTMNNTLLNSDSVVTKFGVAPNQIIDYLSLIGDTSDNIPGVPKVGPKTAVKWLDQYKSLDAIMQSAEKFGGKVGENLRATLPQLPLSKELVTIKCDVELPYKLADLTQGQADHDTLCSLFSNYDFKSWLRELEHDDPEPVKKTDKNYQVIFTQEAFDSLIKVLSSATLFAFDTETTSLDYMNAEIVGVSFSIKENEAYYIPVAHDYPGAPKQLDRDHVLKSLKPLLECNEHKKVGQNLKYDKEVLANYAINLQGIAFDTMLESYVLNSTGTRHDMDSLALKYLAHTTINFEDIAGKGVKQLSFNQIDIDVAGPYAAEDADITLQLHNMIWPSIEKDEKLKFIFENIELPLLDVLVGIERTGVKINSDLLQKQSHKLASRILKLEEEAYQIADAKFNLASPKQLQAIFFEQLGLPVIKKTPKGQPSTAEEVLRDLALEYELPKVILEHRSLSKLKSTYTDRLPEDVNQNTGRVHTSYHQAVAGTGRLSSSTPNLQNIPIRTEEGRLIRQAFIVPKGYQLISADYSQVELRIMAHLSKDEGLLDAFAKGLDVHKATAAQVFSVSIENVTTEQRRKSKAINFGLIYGMSAFGLAKQIGVERQAAQAYMDSYFEQYPGVLKYMETTRSQAHEKGFVETLFGRRLHLPEINSKNVMRQKASERAAINAPMQGTAADIIKIAMVNVQNWLKSSKNDARIIMQVHDELVIEAKSSEVDVVRNKVCELMSSAAELDIPLVVDAGVGYNWDEAH